MAFEFNNYPVSDIHDELVQDLHYSFFQSLWGRYTKVYSDRVDKFDRYYKAGQKVGNNSNGDIPVMSDYVEFVHKNCNSIKYIKDSNTVIIKSAAAYVKLMCMLAYYNDIDFSIFRYSVTFKQRKEHCLELPTGFIWNIEQECCICKLDFNKMSDDIQNIDKFGYPVEFNTRLMKRLLASFINNIDYYNSNDRFIIGPLEITTRQLVRTYNEFELSDLQKRRCPDWSVCQKAAKMHYTCSSEDILELLRLGMTNPRLYYTHQHFAVMLNTLEHNGTIDATTASDIYDLISIMLDYSFKRGDLVINAMSAATIVLNAVNNNNGFYIAVMPEYFSCRCIVSCIYDGQCRPVVIPVEIAPGLPELSSEEFKYLVYSHVNKCYQQYMMESYIETESTNYKYSADEYTCINICAELFTGHQQLKPLTNVI